MQYRLECEPDCSRQGKAVNSKSWFFFSVRGFPKNTKGRFYVTKVQALLSLYYVLIVRVSPNMQSITDRFTESIAESG
jgi:hypothetical protein